MSLVEQNVVFCNCSVSLSYVRIVGFVFCRVLNTSQVTPLRYMYCWRFACSLIFDFDLANLVTYFYLLYIMDCFARLVLNEINALQIVAKNFFSIVS